MQVTQLNSTVSQYDRLSFYGNSFESTKFYSSTY